MLKLKIFFCLLIAVLFAQNNTAQFVNNGQNRASIQWMQIETESFRLVYPDYAEEKARIFAHKLMWASKYSGQDLSKKTTKIDVIMHMESSTSNAMVLWAPKRMEIHALSPQNNYAEDWFEQLALHEYRHVVQVDKLNMGLTKIISLLFGEMGTSVVLGAYLPFWYLEGDAVASETAHSSTGRGRMADFSMPLRALLLELETYSYDKATMGSYKDFVPDHYTLGYHLVSLAKKNYGKDIWRNTEEFIGRNPYFIVPFSHSIYKHSGYRKKKFYEKSMEELTTVWQNTTSNFSYDTLAYNSSKNYTSYNLGQMLNDSILIAVRTGIDHISQFVSININTKEEEKLLTPGYAYFYNISIEDSLLCWTERRPHPRWEQVNYQVLMTYNFRTGKRKQLTHQSNYSFPVLDSKAKKIVCMEQEKTGHSKIIIITADSGKVVQEIPMKKFVKNLCFSKDEKSIFFYRLNNNGFELIQVNLESLEERVLLPASLNNRNRIAESGDSLFFIDDINGISDIYLLNISNNNIQQITDVPFGVHSFSCTDNKLIFDNYSAKGWLLCQIKLSDIQEIQNSDKKTQKLKLYESYISDSTKNIQTDTLPTYTFESKKYSKLKHLFKFHSWGPLAVDADNTEVNPGISIMSQNLLSSMEFSAGYEYVTSESANRYYMDLSYLGWHPRISFGASYQDRNSYYTSESGEKIAYSWNESMVKLNISEGLRFNKGEFNYYILPLVGLAYLHLGANEDTPGEFPSNHSLMSLRYYFYASSYRKNGLRDLEPRWGQNISFEYKHSLNSDLDFGAIGAVQARLYFPAIGKHHNLKFYLGFQNKDANDYTYSDLILLPRGITQVKNDRMQSYQFNYNMPLLYPDLSISSLAYIKRIKTNLFADYAISSWEGETSYHRSLGFDLRFDLHLLRTVAPLDLGLRAAYLPDSESTYFQFLFSVNF